MHIFETTWRQNDNFWSKLLKNAPFWSNLAKKWQVGQFSQDLTRAQQGLLGQQGLTQASKASQVKFGQEVKQKKKAGPKKSAVWMKNGSFWSNLAPKWQFVIKTVQKCTFLKQPHAKMSISRQNFSKMHPFEATWAGLGWPGSSPGLGQGQALGWARVKPWENWPRKLASHASQIMPNFGMMLGSRTPVMPLLR